MSPGVDSSVRNGDDILVIDGEGEHFPMKDQNGLLTHLVSHEECRLQRLVGTLPGVQKSVRVDLLQLKLGVDAGVCGLEV